MQELTLEEMIYLNASTNNGVQKKKQDVIRNLKLSYAIGNDLIKEDIKNLINMIEILGDEEYESLVAMTPFDTGIPDDMLHEEIIDTAE